MRSTRSAARTQATAKGVVFLLASVFVIAVVVLAESSSYDTWVALIIGPALFAVMLPVLGRQAAREGDPRLFWLLAAALALKLGGGVVRHFIAFDVYEGVADAAGYHGWGVRLSEGFRSGNFETELDSLTDTDFVRLLTGIVYTVIGPTQLGGFLVFSWLGFWGLLFFYRAFVSAVPEGRARTYARLLFFLPSLVFWPSSIGKEAWMTFALGIAAFGAARILTGALWRGLVVAGTGAWFAGLVRPHMAGIFALAVGGAYLLRRPREELRELAPVAKGVSLVVLAAAALILVMRTDDFLRESGIETGSGVTSALGQISARTEQGGSRFAPSILESPTRAPVAVGTVLFRPLVTEAHNAQALAAALESTFLLLLALVRLRWGIAALRSMRRQPFVALALLYTALFVFGFSGVANFGILVRQRVQVLPFLLVLLAVPPREVTENAAVDRTPT